MKYEIMKWCWKERPETLDIQLYVDLYNWHYAQNVEITIRFNQKYKQYVQEVDKDLRCMYENRRKVTLQDLETYMLERDDQYDTQRKNHNT